MCRKWRYSFSWAHFARSVCRISLRRYSRPFSLRSALEFFSRCTRMHYFDIHATKRSRQTGSKSAVLRQLTSAFVKHRVAVDFLSRCHSLRGGPRDVVSAAATLRSREVTQFRRRVWKSLSATTEHAAAADASFNLPDWRTTFQLQSTALQLSVTFQLPRSSTLSSVVPTPHELFRKFNV